MGNHTNSCQFAPFSNDLLVMKIVTVSDLCLTYVILFIDLSIMAFGLQTTTNDPCLIHIIFDQNDGPIVGSPFNFCDY